MSLSRDSKCTLAKSPLRQDWLFHENVCYSILEESIEQANIWLCGLHSSRSVFVVLKVSSICSHFGMLFEKKKHCIYVY